MQILDITTLKIRYDKPIVLALGFFECVHLGHRAIIDKVLELSKKHNAAPAITTFTNNPNNKEKKLINNYEERLEKFKNLGLQIVLASEFNDNFKLVQAEEFLELLKTKLKIKALVCGTDYKFGFKAEGCTKILQEFCSQNNIELCIIAPVMRGDTRISSTIIRQYLENNDLEKVKKLLG